MLEELRAAARRSELVLLTGGLGPTADDLTRQALAELGGVPLVEDAASLEHVLDCYRRFGRPMPPANRVAGPAAPRRRSDPEPARHRPGRLADRPARPHRRRRGLHAGRAARVPAEMRPMFEESVAPRLPSGGNLIRAAR